MAIRVVIAEDSYLVREGVVRLLETQEGVEVVGACGDFDGLIATVDAERPDVVLTDIRMPPTGTDEGVRAANQLREDHPEIGVVMLSQYAEPAYALALLEHGSAGRAYLLKERVSDPNQLVHAIQEVARGGSVIDPMVVESLVRARASRPASPVDRLTPREREVLEQMAQGRNNAGIAQALHLSERAVEKHINSLFAKLDLGEEIDVHRRVKAVLLFLAEQGG
jgi:DNA-binding NarL/FixJ family response regulator